MRKPTWLRAILAKFGLFEQQPIGLDANLNALPVYMYLADDRNVRVRRVAIGQLANWRILDDDDILPVLRCHLDDPDPHCRMFAAVAVWEATKKAELVEIFLALKDHADPEVRSTARMRLCMMSSEHATLFENVANFEDDPTPGVRYHVVNAMRHFGKKGVPVLQRAFGDKGVRGVCGSAVLSAGALGKDGMDLVPSLQAMQNDPDPILRSAVERALHRIDPTRFPKPADPVE